jgi:organic hydroperoxide reductase OsmC/OhrA
MPETNQEELSGRTRRRAARTAHVVSEFRLNVEQVDGFEFRVRFDKATLPELRMDEPPPLGQDRGPNPARILAAAIGNCLAASLLFCLQKRALQPIALGAVVDVQLVRNERRLLRVGQVRVTLRPHVTEPDAEPVLAECMEHFKEFCVVTESVREGIDIDVRVEPVIEGVEGPCS